MFTSGLWPGTISLSAWKRWRSDVVTGGARRAVVELGLAPVLELVTVELVGLGSESASDILAVLLT
jgi:hypothetical protein